MARYWDRGNRAEWNALSRKPKKKTPEQERVAREAMAKIKRILEGEEPEPGSVSRETPE